jgi:hypothetical protein
MAWSWFPAIADRPHRTGRRGAGLPCLALAGALAAAAPAAAQSVTAAEREELVALRAARGGQAAEVDALLRHADEAASRGLPADPLTNKIREGLAKGHDPKRIEDLVRRMVVDLETADRLVRELGNVPAGSRAAAVALLADSLGAGVAPDEIRALARQGQAAKAPPAAEELANAAKALSLIKAAKLPAADAASVIAEAMRQGFRPRELADLGREVKRREGEYQAGRATLRELREAIARGERPERLFRGVPANAAARPAARPDAGDRPDRPARPQPQERPSRPERPEAPAAPGR